MHGKRWSWWRQKQGAGNTRESVTISLPRRKLVFRRRKVSDLKSCFCPSQLGQGASALGTTPWLSPQLRTAPTPQALPKRTQFTPLCCCHSSSPTITATLLLLMCLLHYYYFYYSASPSTITAFFYYYFSSTTVSTTPGSPPLSLLLLLLLYYFYYYYYFFYSSSFTITPPLLFLLLLLYYYFSSSTTISITLPPLLLYYSFPTTPGVTPSVSTTTSLLLLLLVLLFSSQPPAWPLPNHTCSLKGLFPSSAHFDDVTLRTPSLATRFPRASRREAVIYRRHTQRLFASTRHARRGGSLLKPSSSSEESR